MYLPITTEERQLPLAQLSARGRLPTHLLVYWQQQTGVVRLGQHYHQLNAGALLWLPADTLFMLGGAAGAQFRLLWLSCRLTLPVPPQAGQLDDPWLQLSMARADQHKPALLAAIAEAICEQHPQPLPPLTWPAAGPLASVASTEAARKGQGPVPEQAEPRPLMLSPGQF